MKKYIYSILILSVSFLFFACEDMYDIHKKYLDEGEDVYIGYPNIVDSRGGYNRVQLIWKINSDPKIDACYIYWNNRKDSLVVSPNREDTVMRQIVELPEGKYQIEMLNKSKLGYTSLKSQVSVESYGESYKDRLYNRTITSMTATPNGVTLGWSLEEGCIGVNFSYKNKNGDRKEVLIGAEQTSLTLEDFKLNGEFTYSSLYLPEANALDTIAAYEEVRNFPSYYVLSKEEWEEKYHNQFADLDRSTWSITASTEELNGEGAVNGRATTLLDGNLATFWHTQWQNGTANMPHQINLDMNEIQTLTSIELARRANNKDTKKVEFSISMDGVKWSEIGVISYPNTPAPNSKVLMFPEAVKGRYLRLMITESNNEPHASLSEITMTTKK